MKAHGIIYKSHEGDLSHYFRSLYSTLKFIDEKGGDDTKLYVRVVRSQLSSHQLAVLFYNCLYGKGCEKIRLLIERHKFFKKILIYC
ncbi:putative phage abortive infection protein [Microbulbifer sp. JMSA008]|uniref:putative phage abortive infection protein n=1 Tax=Microbulbifer sp. JMSA008 TaxID=3243373 RepID=UPI00403A1986